MSDTKSPARGQPFVGYFLVAIMLNSFWTGVMHVQAYLLYRKFPKDPFYIKLIVSVLCLSQNFYFGTCLSFVHYTLIAAAKHPVLLLDPPWEIRYIATHRLLTTTLTQLFFVGRLWAYGINIWMMLSLSMMVLGTLALGIVENNTDWHLQYTSNSVLFFWSLSAWNCSIVVVDCFISISLVLVMLRRRSGFKSTNSVMNLITLYGVATGGLSSLLALAGLIFNQVKSYPGLFVTTTWGPAITICAVLANLQVRSSLRALIPAEQSIPIPNFSLRPPNSAPRRHSMAAVTQPCSSNSASLLQNESSTMPGVQQEHQGAGSSTTSPPTIAAAISPNDITPLSTELLPGPSSRQSGDEVLYIGP